MDFSSSEVLSRKLTLPHTLPEFIERFDQEINPYLKVVDFNYFLNICLESFYEEESERTLFFQFVSRIPELFDDVLRFDNNTGNEKFEKETKLQCYNHIMDAFLQSFTYTKSTPEVMSVLQASVILLNKGYSHCKDCEIIYGDLLEEFKSQLGSFLNKMQDVIQEIRLKFSRILDQKLHLDQFHFLKPIICDLNKLCELVFILDSRVGMDLYKILIMLIETYKEIGRIELQIDSMLTGLFSEIISIGEEFRLDINNKKEIPVPECRMFLFKLNVVKKIIKMFPSFIKENLQSTIHLVLNLYELLISCYLKFPTENEAKCLKNILLENISPMLSLFYYSEKTFLTSVLLLNSKDVSSDLQIPHLLLKLSALSFILASGDQDRLSEKKDVIQSIFLMLEKNIPRDDMLIISLQLPLSLYKLSKSLLAFHQSQSGAELEELRSATLYCHAYLHVSEYSKGMSDSDVQNLENFVIDFLLRDSSISATILISDMWIYRLRCSSAENLFARCLSFSKRLSDLPSNSVGKLLFKRMIKFLPLNLKERLFEQDEQLKVLVDGQDKILHRYGAPQLSNNFQVNENNVDKNISALLDELKKQDFTNNEQLVRKACHILELFAVCVNVLEIQEFLRFAEFATLMFKSEIYEIQIAVLTFLRALNFKKFNDKDPLFANVRGSLAVLYNEALRTKNYIVRVEALSIFYTMAQFTDIRITQETIAKFPELYPGIKAYVSETPEAGFLASDDKSELLEKQVSSFDGKAKQSSNVSNGSKSVLSLLKPF
ncbi:uncharacterized protein LOC129988457 [Argiope bruennichi]|uniref:Uncharacterized protein n=1 Tax=Argiope bruennichi TaxID=94029 RepID=A0A8T0EF77_ARGBR|nr:uncharacterized protein LOC129988457 [Argiope bruennichi]KAF8771772.1 hypothetical protein HNY73_019147 [Argiope bruennichi]